MADETNTLDMQFYGLILSLQAAAMQQMGKTASAVSGKIDRNLEMARQTIDMLEMIEHISRGNLNDDQRKLLTHILYELRLNFVDESKKNTPAPNGSKTVTSGERLNEEKKSE
ncbi:MAG: DUF1844 domain-containing protein [candidate division Zixibacteria bacterium]|nr:DUF1844 domain-containing protein [candidate division Zixibacteria bacterium]